MRSGLILLSLFIASNVMANTNKELVCNDQNSHAVYALKLNENKLEIKPLIKDSSTLSSSEITLNYEEGESSEANKLFSGKNKDNKTIVAILSAEQVKNIKANQIIEVQVLFSGDTKKLDQRTEFLCSQN